MNNTVGSCYHCGLETPIDTPYRCEMDGQQQSFCCPACQQVAKTINGLGLDDYYRKRTRNASSLLDRKTADFSFWDDPALQQDFISHESASCANMSILVDELHCAACCWLIEKSLLREKGIASVSVNLATHKAQIVFDPQNITPSAIFKKLENIGYSALPATEDQLQQHAQSARREDLKRLGLAGLIMMQTGMFSIALYAGDFQGIAAEHQKLIRVFSLLLSTLLLLYCARPFFAGALRNLKQASLGMDTPVSIALAGAWIASFHATLTGSGHVYFDSIAMFTFLLLLARFIESASRNHPSYWHFHPAIPRHCKKLQKDGSSVPALVANLKTGDRVIIDPGETIVADGIIVEGSASVDDSSITGEFAPLLKHPGDSVFAGSINHDGRLQVELTHEAGQSSLSLINRLTEQAMEAKPAIASLAERVATGFTVIVLGSTLLTALAWWWLVPEVTPRRLFEICFAMLVVSCPCALSLATPAALAFTHNAFRAKGVFIIKNNVIERLERITAAFFDKTGTLTEARFEVTTIQVTGHISASQCLEIARRMESVSNHPVASAFSRKATEETTLPIVKPPTGFTLFNGQGIEATLESGEYRIGSQSFCQQWLQQPAPETERLELQFSTIWLVSRSRWLACFYLQDPVRHSAETMIRALKNSGIQTGILTGDASSSAEYVANRLGVDSLYKGLTANQKLQHIQQQQKTGRSILMVGDGINDAPVLAAADVSIAMGNASDISKSQADILLCSNNLQDVADIIAHARKTLQIIRQNIAWALLYNGSVLPLAAIGWIPPWLAAIGMSLSSLAVILNARRLQLPQQRNKQNG